MQEKSHPEQVKNPMVIRMVTCKLSFCGFETVHRQDSSPTRNLEKVYRQNWRQLTHTFEDS